MVQTADPRSQQHPFSTDKDISSTAFWAQPFEERDTTFAWLREHAPVSWHPPLEVPGLPPEVHGETGFWALVRAAEVAFASQNHQLFSSDSVKWRPPTLRPSPRKAPGAKELVRRSTFMSMDPPRHTEYRRVLSKHFTPKGVARLHDKLTERTTQIIDRVIGAGDIDFVAEVSAKLPMLTIADLVGVPDDQVQAFAAAGDNFVSAHDPDVTAGADPVTFMTEQMRVLREIGTDLVTHRRAHPADDLATALAQTEIDGRLLDEYDIEAVMLLLSVAGNDTTKQTTSHAVLQLWRHPEQKKLLTADYDNRIATAIEEFVRHTTPVLYFARTATQDIELCGQTIQTGDKVGLLYCSSNRDETVFTDPHRFDITRTPHPHQGFGGGGVHYCLGNILAKAELRALLYQILTKLPHMQVGEPEMLKNTVFNAVHRLPVRSP